MTSISSPPSGGSLYSTSISGLDANGDGIVSAEELAATEKASGWQRTQDPTVQNENAASGVASRIAGGMMYLLLANARGEAQGQVDLRPEGPHPVEGQSDDDDDTVSLFDVLEEMRHVIAAYTAHADRADSDDREDEGAGISL
ncbi:MAG: hypothetical protein KUL88_04950 [Rhizobium sp.]|nr:hypothetical protein [Rhizobium sp.]